MKKQREGELPPRLRALLEAIVDRDLAARLEIVLVAAGRCIERLAAIDLVALEPKSSDEGTADLSVWETMAPAVGETLVAINELCAVIDGSFPPGTSRQSVFGEEQGSDRRAELEASFVFRTISPLLRAEVAHVGNLMKRPDQLASPWSVLSELHRARALLRARVGDAVYLAAAALGPVTRDEVVPGMEQEVRRALSFRGTEAALRRTLVGRLQAIEASGASFAKNLDEDLAAFSAMPAWRHVNVTTKRQMLQVREQLRWLAESNTTRGEKAAVLVQPLLDVLGRTSSALSHSVLAGHDRRARAEALLRVEQALLHLELETGAAEWALEAALEAAELLRGRDVLFDEVLRALRARPVAELARDELAPAAAKLSAALGSLEV